jgi:hypothetical protein
MLKLTIVAFMAAAVAAVGVKFPNVTEAAVGERFPNVTGTAVVNKFPNGTEAVVREKLTNGEAEEAAVHDKFHNGAGEEPDVREQFPKEPEVVPAKEFPDAIYKSPGVGQVPLAVFSVVFQRPDGSDPVPWGARRQTLYLGLENQNAECWHPFRPTKKMHNPNRAYFYLRGDELFLYGGRKDLPQQVYIDRACTFNLSLPLPSPGAVSFLSLPVLFFFLTCLRPDDGRLRFVNRKKWAWMPHEPIRDYDDNPIWTAEGSGWWVDNGTLRYMDQETMDCKDTSVIGLTEETQWGKDKFRDEGRYYYPAIGYSAPGWGMAEGCEPRIATIIPGGLETPCQYDKRARTPSWPWEDRMPWGGDPP